MKENNLKPSERPLVKYVPDYELAYVMQRYKEVHDFLHVLLGCADVSIKSELYVKWYEMSQLGLPSAVFSSYCGAFLLNQDEKVEYLKKLPIISKNAQNGKYFMNYMWEELLEEK